MLRLPVGKCRFLAKSSRCASTSHSGATKNTSPLTDGSRKKLPRLVKLVDNGLRTANRSRLKHTVMDLGREAGQPKLLGHNVMKQMM